VPGCAGCTLDMVCDVLNRKRTHIVRKFMEMHYYTQQERVKQLKTLIDALSELIPLIANDPLHVRRSDEYIDALERAKLLLSQGFCQEELSALSRSVPDLYFRHKDWQPPMERDSEGNWHETIWFADLEKKLLPALNAAQVLRTIGYY
jgi:hypothetical protein